jgi:hypothetical protein
MKVGQLINQADASEVARIYNETYNSGERNDGWGSPEVFDRFRERINFTIGINEGDDQCKVVIEWVDQKWGGPNNDKYHDQYFHVGARRVLDPKQVYSLSMTDWGVWKEMEVEDETNKNLSTNELAAHIYYEMTWFGWPETMEEKRDSLIDMAEQVQRDFADYKEGDPLPEGYSDFNEVFGKDGDEG